MLCAKIKDQINFVRSTVNYRFNTVDVNNSLIKSLILVMLNNIIMLQSIVITELLNFKVIFFIKVIVTRPGAYTYLTKECFT